MVLIFFQNAPQVVTVTRPFTLGWNEQKYSTDPGRNFVKDLKAEVAE